MKKQVKEKPRPVSELDILNWMQIQPEDFNLKNSQFVIQSTLHGTGHVYRTMINVLWIAWLRQDALNGRLAFFGAYIHDLARTHDCLCTRHGADSVQHCFPLYESLFRKYGATDAQLDYIRAAVEQHAYPETLDSSQPGWLVLAMLKDADAELAV